MSAVKMEIWVYNGFERAVINEGLEIIDRARHAQMEAMKGNVPPGQMQDAPAGDAQAEESVGGKVVGSIPRPVAEMAAAQMAETIRADQKAEATVEEAEMAAVVQKALDTIGLAKVRDIIAPITGGKRWRESDKSLWLEIKLALSVAVAEHAKVAQ